MAWWLFSRIGIAFAALLVTYLIVGAGISVYTMQECMRLGYISGYASLFLERTCDAERSRVRPTISLEEARRAK